MSENKLEEKITIIVPCKNEEYYIHYLLDSLRLQEIGNTKIIIADCSTDNTRKVIKEHSSFLNIEIIDGGIVSVARNSGAKLATTPYILFIDSDVVFFKNTVISDCVKEMENKQLDLIGLKIKCYDGDIRAQIGFMLFNAINSIMKYKVPFAVGAFMLARTDKFREFGGFSEKHETSEDFFLSKKFDVKKFKLMNHYFGQDSRRFVKMGYTGMAWYLIKNFWNRNNNEYWNNMDYSKYWK
jgi:glycosyltransferase involved in cell wall biosynthesis